MSPREDRLTEPLGTAQDLSTPSASPMSPRDKRLAMPTEDHPLAYRHFEEIPTPSARGSWSTMSQTVFGWESVYR